MNGRRRQLYVNVVLGRPTEVSDYWPREGGREVSGQVKHTSLSKKDGFITPSAGNKLNDFDLLSSVVIGMTYMYTVRPRPYVIAWVVVRHSLRRNHGSKFIQCAGALARACLPASYAGVGDSQLIDSISSCLFI